MRLPIILTATLLATASAAVAEPMRTTVVKTHPSQGDVTTVADGTARMMAHDGGLFVNFDTSGLTPGQVHTLWFVAINDPEGCFDPTAAAAGKKKRAEDCTSFDVLKRSEVTQSDVGYGGGIIVGADGSASFNWHQSEGPLSGGWFGHGLVSSRAAEIHLVINDHGPVIEGRVDRMLATYRDGCRDDSIPAPMPATARVQGEAGPNTCRLVQFAIFEAPGKSS